MRRVPGCACGSVRLFRTRRGCARGGAGRVYTPASSWCVCTGSGCARAAAPRLGTLAPGGDVVRLGARLMASVKGFEERGEVQPTFPWCSCAVLPGRSASFSGFRFLILPWLLLALPPRASAACVASHSVPSPVYVGTQCVAKLGWQILTLPTL